MGSKVTYRADSTIFTAQANQLLEGKPDAWVFFDFLDTYVKIALEMSKDKKAGWKPTQDLRHRLARQPAPADLGSHGHATG